MQSERAEATLRSHLNLARKGESKDAAEALRGLAKWVVATDNNFEGTTIFSKNADVDRFNTLRYMQLTGKELRFRSQRWGKLRGEWKIIPDAFNLKIGTYVMILTNAPRQGPQTLLDYANGDQGKIVEFSPNGVYVKLDRTGLTHLIPFITRRYESKETPDPNVRTQEQGGGKEAPYFDAEKKRWVYGGITYLPVRLAYAATVHKTQGLTLDNVQLDIRGHFFGSPNMAYVALSRVKSPKGLRIVGTPELLARRINIAPEVLPWV